MAATIIIEQAPTFNTLTAGQEIIFTVSEANIVANETRVKFIAEVFVSLYYLYLMASLLDIREERKRLYD